MTSFDFEQAGRRSYELGAHSFTMKVKSTDSMSDRVEALRQWWFEHCTLVAPAAFSSSFDPESDKAA
jgi:hypothetical protein